MIYFLDGNQEVIKIVRGSAVISAIQTQELPEDNSLLRDYLSVRLKNDERLFNAQYMAVKSYGGNRNAFDLYRIASELVPDNATEFMGVQVAPYELEGVVIEDLRPQDRPLNQTMSQVLEGSDWRIGYVADNLPNVTTNFYYMSVKDALKKIQELTNTEMVFKVEISGNKITDKWVEVYHQLGNRTMKRFNYGTNALSVVRESSHDELYTALIGRGKGEEVGETESGDATYGRKINFADVEWKKSAGNPVDKPKGQKYIELPNATAEYGIKLIDGRKVPRIGIVEFSDTDDPNVLINQTYQELLARARPKVLFKASVINTGDMLIGDTVTIHRHDLNFHYQARVRKVVRDRKNNNKTQVEIGDVVHTASTKRQGQINSALNNVASDLENARGEITEARQSADGKNTNFYGNVEPDRKQVGDTWFRDHPSLTGESQILVWNGEAWELTMDTSETTKNADAIAEQQQEIEEAKQVADEAVGQINTAVANAGFTSLDDTLQNMNHITLNAEQSAQQAITNASNAYGLAQTSISEAQTAQANSLTALGKADNALDGVSDLDIRVDDVEAELELKADNTFMTEDGELITLSNAITVNAARFSSDMSRIESRVESLSGEINLVILRGSIENRLLYGTEVFPNAPTYSASTNVMGELIKVVGGESFALSKELTGADDRWRIVFYDENRNFISRFHPPVNTQDIMVAPSNARYMWVSYPRDSKPQITRGTDFIPYRPNLADQMTADEVTIFRNEYDEFADKTERRLTAIDSSGGRLETAELLINQTADGLTLKADQTTVNELTEEVESLGTEFDIVAGQVSSKVWKTDIDNIEIGGRNYFSVSKLTPKPVIGVDYPSDRVYHFNLEPETEYVISTDSNLSAFRLKNGGEYYRVTFAETNDKGHKLTTDSTGVISIGFWENEVDTFINGGNLFKIEKGNKATDWTPAIEDTDAKIDYIEAEWIQTFDAFSQTVSSIDGRVTSQKQTIDGINTTIQSVKTDVDKKATITALNAVSNTVGGHTSTLSTLITDVNGKATVSQFNTLNATVNGTITRVGNAEGKITQIETNVNGLQTTVADKANQSQVTQLANGYNILVGQSLKSLVSKNLYDDTSEWNIGSYITYHGGSTNNLAPIYVTGSNPDTQFAGNRIYVNSVLKTGRKYKITLDVWSVYERQISIGQPDSSNNVRLTVDNTTKTYEVIYEASNNNGFSIYFHEEGTYRIGNITVVESTAISQSQISVLQNNINLRVQKGELLSQINIEAGRTLIQSDKLLLDASNVVFTGKAWIPSTVIGDLEADKITSGRLDAGKITVVNLDVSSLSGNTADFVRAAFNSISSTTSIDANGISIQRANGTRSARLGINGYEFWLDGKEHGTMGVRGSLPTHIHYPKKSVSLYARNDAFVALSYQGSSTDGAGYSALTVDGESGNVNIHRNLGLTEATLDMNGNNTVNQHSIRFGVNDVTTGRIYPHEGTDALIVNGTELLRLSAGGYSKIILNTDNMAEIYTNINMNNWNTTNQNNLSFGAKGEIVGRIFPIVSNNELQIRGHSLLRFVVDQKTMMDIKKNGTTDLYAHLNMQGYNITNQSDYRLKRDIDGTELDSLTSIESWEIVDYNWIDNELNKRTGRQLGLIAQDTPELATYDTETDTWSINSSKQIMMNSHAIQQLAFRERDTNRVAESNEEKIHQLQQELSKANRRIEELESVM